MMLAIAKREWQALFRSPLAWIIAAVLQVVFAYLFLLALEDYLMAQPKLATQENAPGITAFMTYRYLAPASTLFLLMCPLLSMRLFADEYRLHTFPLLLSSPISATSMVLGKFLGVMLFVLLLIVLMLAMPVTLGLVSGIDINTLALAALGIVCLAAAASAVGLYFSSLSQHSMVAAISSIATLCFLWLLGKGSFSHPWVAEAMSAFSLSTHLTYFFQGIFNTREIVYFAIVTALFLLLCINRIDARRHVASN